MRISDWSSDVCSSDLGHEYLQRLAWRRSAQCPVSEGKGAGHHRVIILRAVGREEARHETRVLPGGLATKRRESREMFEPFAPDRRDAAKLVGGGGPRFARPHHRHTVAAARNGIGNREQGDFGAAVVAMKTRQGEKQLHLRNSPVRRMFSHAQAAVIPPSSSHSQPMTSSPLAGWYIRASTPYSEMVSNRKSIMLRSVTFAAPEYLSMPDQIGRAACREKGCRDV